MANKKSMNQIYRLSFSFIFIQLFFSCQSEPVKNTAPNSNAAIDSTQTNQTVELLPDSLQSLKLIFIGDIMQHGDQIRSAFDPASGLFDYEPCFRYIRPILEQADLAIGNLELTLNDKNYYSGFPRFRSPDALAGYLKQAGFDVLVTSNNHSNDNDRHGVVHTLDVLDSLGIVHTGTFRDTAEWENNYPLIMEKSNGQTNFKLALLNYTYATNGIPTKKPSVVNEIVESQILKDIEKAKRSNPDMIIAFMHWGGEYQLNEAKSQRDLARLLWDNGVDLVIGAHPHVIQPIKTDTLYNADSSASRPVLAAYSLGNFISNQFRPNTDIGLLFEIEIIKNTRSGKTTIGQHAFIPSWRYIHNYNKKPVADWVHTLIPVSAFIKDTSNFLKMPSHDFNKMKTVYEKTCAHLEKWQGKERKISFEEIYSKIGASPDSVITKLPKVDNPFVAKVLK